MGFSPPDIRVSIQKDLGVVPGPELDTALQGCNRVYDDHIQIRPVALVGLSGVQGRKSGVFVWKASDSLPRHDGLCPV